MPLGDVSGGQARSSISFAQWTGDPSVRQGGEDGTGKYVDFISHRKLSEHWAWWRVQEVLHGFYDVTADIRTIRSSYLRVFSILVFTDRLKYIEHFTEHGVNDERLPLLQRPASWPESRKLDAVFGDFLKHQWKFCPLQLSAGALTGQRLDPRHILPIQARTVLRKSNAISEVVRVTFHSDCVDQGLPTTMVLKAYTDTSMAPQLYKAEVNAFTKIYNSAPNPTTPKPQYIVEFYGNFIQSNKHYLLLEFASEGNLDMYFESTSPPKSPWGMFQFWESMFKLIGGLVLIHNLGGRGELAASSFLGTHQDIKPDNILVNSKGTPDEYSLTLKIADFGASDFWRVSDGDPDALGIDKKGDQVYSAPECIANYEALRRIINRVGPEVDIWSLGCVFSEAAVWAVCGHKGRERYRESRLQETKRIDSIRGTGFDGCFHDGIEPLNAVTCIHEHIRRSRQAWDTITPKITQLISESMLLDSMGPRKTARELLLLSGRLLQTARDEAFGASHTPVPQLLVLDQPALPPIPPPPDTSKITIEEVQRYRSDMKRRRPPNEHVATACESLQRQIRGRDHVFLIDDSTSMKTKYRNDVVNTFIALSYVAKRIDGDGIDLFFTSEPSRRYHSRHTSKLTEELQLHYQSASNSRATMEASVSEVIDYIVKKLPSSFSKSLTGLPGISHWLAGRPKITLFVFTDGLWGCPAAISRVENQIERLRNELQGRGLSRVWVAIQFIRFGDEGIEYLRHLDNFDPSWDIVDSKSHKDHVLDMFIGSIDEEVDNKDDYTYEGTSARDSSPNSASGA
ncbi:hypothetical protein GGS23DRAFT_209034 [Durotheca rogersii]|uniref:uncharacterized protein n=1 Tax=Durotheca rogersii TaxID=419775 RepID=UPI002220AFDB|nr:uncharacterized protein GGS23DRAFT_209034 [Durotheca rogersii]KAI5861106.1 hypothetical protein GGS23DRAFT_209034 [Durotheca rogersii]